jgi:toxin-antitoxin system PIN domain toxin
MSCFLLDANALIALAWPSHSDHEKVERWFARNGRKGWATCPLTECAFVRIISNPGFSAHALPLPSAVKLLSLNLEHPAHRFWGADITFADAVRSFSNGLVGHQQVTDAYLLGLALHKKGKLATLDQSIGRWLEPTHPARGCAELIGS